VLENNNVEQAVTLERCRETARNENKLNKEVLDRGSYWCFGVWVSNLNTLRLQNLRIIKVSYRFVRFRIKKLKFLIKDTGKKRNVYMTFLNPCVALGSF